MSRFQEIINGDKPVLVDFFATWCGPCQMMPPILNKVKEEMGEQVSILKVDVDKNQEVAQALQVQSIPTLIVFKNGKVLWRHTGVAQAHELKAVLQQYV